MQRGRTAPGGMGGGSKMVVTTAKMVVKLQNRDDKGGIRHLTTSSGGKIAVLPAR